MKITMTCPRCLTTIAKSRWQDPWVCRCGWRSDDPATPDTPAHAVHLDQLYPIV